MKIKDHRLEKYMSKFLISEVPALKKLRTGSMKRLNDKSDAPAARHGILPEIFTSSRKQTKLHSTRPPKKWIMPAASTIKPEERVCGGQGVGFVRNKKKAVADSRGSRTCVCANTFTPGVAHAGREGRINVLPWYRLVGVAKTSS